MAVWQTVNDRGRKTAETESVTKKREEKVILRLRFRVCVPLLLAGLLTRLQYQDRFSPGLYVDAHSFSFSFVCTAKLKPLP